MKKLMTIMISAMLVLSFAAATLATTLTTDGRLRLKYIEKNNSKDDAHDLLVNLNAKVTDETSLFAAVGSTTAKSVYLDEFYGTCQKPYGTIKLGKLYYSTYGDDLAILTQVIDDLQADFGVSYQAPLKDGYIAKVYYGAGKEKSGTDNMYAATLGYAKETWGADVSLVESRLQDVYTTTKEIKVDNLNEKNKPYIINENVTHNGDYAKTGIAFNAFFVPLKPVRLYYNYETRKEYHTGSEYEYKNSIIGATYSPIEKLKFIGEYNFTKTDQDTNNWGVRANYQLDKATTLSLIRSQEVLFDYDADQFKDSNKTEFRVQIKF